MGFWRKTLQSADREMVWAEDVLTEYGGQGRKFVPAGDYAVTLSYGSIKQKQKLHVDLAPGLETR